MEEKKKSDTQLCNKDFRKRKDKREMQNECTKPFPQHTILIIQGQTKAN